VGAVAQTVSRIRAASRMQEILSERRGIGSEVADLKTCLRSSSGHSVSFT